MKRFQIVIKSLVSDSISPQHHPITTSAAIGRVFYSSKAFVNWVETGIRRSPLGSYQLQKNHRLLIKLET
jgi:hypothetical protein